MSEITTEKRNRHGWLPSEVIAWRDAAVADGWTITPTYGREDVSRASTLARDGYKAMLLTREPIPGDRWATTQEYTLNLWCPRGIDIRPPAVYDWAKIVAGTRTCSVCGATDVDTQRVAFANRACAACAPALRKKMETPGWCD